MSDEDKNAKGAAVTVAIMVGILRDDFKVSKEDALKAFLWAWENMKSKEPTK